MAGNLQHQRSQHMYVCLADLSCYCCPAHYCQKCWLQLLLLFCCFFFEFYLIFIRSVRIFTLPKCPSALLTETAWPPAHSESELNSVRKLRLNSFRFTPPPQKHIFVIRFLSILAAYPLASCSCFVVIALELYDLFAPNRWQVCASIVLNGVVGLPL